MASGLISSLARCSIPRVSFISRSQFYSTTPLISRTMILRNLISKPCCAVSFRYASSTSLASGDDKIKRADENLLLVVESVIAKKNLRKKVWPKDFQFEIIENYPEDGLITLKREYYGEQIQAVVEWDDTSSISLVVYIDKKVGPTLSFCCVLTADDFEIESIQLESSDLNDVYLCDSDKRLCKAFDKRLCKAFDEYLAARGFTKSLYDCLRYWIGDQPFFPWESLKKLVEK